MNSIYVAFRSSQVLGKHFLSSVLLPSWRDSSEFSDISWKNLDDNNICVQPVNVRSDSSSLSYQAPFFLTFAGSGGDDKYDACVATDWIILAVMFLVVHSISWSIRWTCWKPFFLWQTGNAARRNRLSTDLENFAQCMTAFFFHCLSGYFSYRILVRKAWLFDQNEWFRVREMTDSDFKFYYLLYASRYLSDLISLCFEPTRSDTWAYAVHHVVTVAAVLGSAQAGYTQAGGIIMFMFDWADPFMLAAKAFRYLSRNESDWYQFLVDRLFELFAVVFFLTRNVFFNYILYVHFTENNKGSESTLARKILSCLLAVLAFLMTYWLAVILSAALNYQDKGNVEDIREREQLAEKSKQKAW